MSNQLLATAATWPGPAGQLRGITLDRLADVTAGFTATDWARIEDEHLDIVGLRMLDEIRTLGIDMDEDPIAVFCQLYLMAREARIASRCVVGGTR